MGDVEKRLREIEVRNKRVELDKAWETSWTRKIILSSPFVNSIVPTTGFVLSTLSLPFFRKAWVRCGGVK